MKTISAGRVSLRYRVQRQTWIRVYTWVNGKRSMYGSVETMWVFSSFSWAHVHERDRQREQRNHTDYYHSEWAWRWWVVDVSDSDARQLGWRTSWWKISNGCISWLTVNVRGERSNNKRHIGKMSRLSGCCVFLSHWVSSKYTTRYDAPREPIGLPTSMSMEVEGHVFRACCKKFRLSLFFRYGLVLPAYGYSWPTWLSFWFMRQGLYCRVRTTHETWWARIRLCA